MKMNLMKNKKYLQQQFSWKVLISQTTVDFTMGVNKSYVPFTCKFPMVMHFVSILHRDSRSKTDFHIFSYDKTSSKFCASFRFFLAVFMEKFQKIWYLNYVRRGMTRMLRNRHYETLNKNSLANWPKSDSLLSIIIIFANHYMSKWTKNVVTYPSASTTERVDLSPRNTWHANLYVVGCLVMKPKYLEQPWTHELSIYYMNYSKGQIWVKVAFKIIMTC